VSIRINLPYEPGPDGRPRPYLWLELHGPGGSVRVRGVLDSGAGVSVLPRPYARMLGLEEALYEVPVESGGSAVQSELPVTAYVPGAPEQEVRLQPAFVDAHRDPRWGRDFMRVWSVSFAEREQQFVLWAA
jgi:hypothetical protein